MTAPVAIILPMTQLRAITGVVEALEVLDAHGTVQDASISAQLGAVNVLISCDLESGDFAVELSPAGDELVEDEQPSTTGLAVQLRDVVAPSPFPSSPSA